MQHILKVYTLHTCHVMKLFKLTPLINCGFHPITMLCSFEIYGDPFIYEMLEQRNIS
jgi:hypothetical protein